MKYLALLSMLVAAVCGIAFDAPTDKLADKLDDAFNSKPAAASLDVDEIVAQCGVQSYGVPYGADCSTSSYGYQQAYGAECAASPSAYGYAAPQYQYAAAPRYAYQPTYSYQPRYGYSAPMQSYGYGYAPQQPYGGGYSRSYGFNVGPIGIGAYSSGGYGAGAAGVGQWVCGPNGCYRQ